MLQIISFGGGEEPRGSPHLACGTTEAGRQQGGGQGSCWGLATSVPGPRAFPSAEVLGTVCQHTHVCVTARAPAPCVTVRVTAEPLQGPPASPSGFLQQPRSLQCSPTPSPRRMRMTLLGEPGHLTPSVHRGWRSAERARGWTLPPGSCGCRRGPGAPQPQFRFRWRQ